ncbi:MAG: hypothetical protein IPO22_14520 [Anaerolineales bacterium]|nr:hypothetical protein [Anaerolineales bacterium]
MPAGEFYFGQHEDIESTGVRIMVTDVTVSQYADFLNAALRGWLCKIGRRKIVSFYPGDEYRGLSTRERSSGQLALHPLDDPSQRIKFDGTTFFSQEGYANHP